MLTVPNPFHAGVLIKKPEVSVSGKMYIILSLPKAVLIDEIKSFKSDLLSNSANIIAMAYASLVP